jgi:hypothetical protein
MFACAFYLPLYGFGPLNTVKFTMGFELNKKSRRKNKPYLRVIFTAGFEPTTC